MGEYQIFINKESCLFIYLFIYCWHYYRCHQFPPPLSPSTRPPLPLAFITLLSVLWAMHTHTHTHTHTCSLVIFSSPHHHPPLWDLSVCSMSPYLWCYFVCQFFLFLRFHIWVRSYGVCLSLPGLFSLA